MTIEQAKNLGRKETIKWTLYTFLIVELIFLFLETRGDFANGIIFFIEGHKNSYYLSMVIILFTGTYYFGPKKRNGYSYSWEAFFSNPV
jgi:hypothetical protein